MKRNLILWGILCCLVLGGSLAVAAPASDGSWTASQTTLSFYGQSTFLLSHGDTQVLIDPWFTGNRWGVADAGQISCQYILVSHAHQDHMGDAAAIAKRTGAKVISTAEITRLLNGQGVQNIAPMSIGGQRQFDFGSVKVTLALHGSGVAGGQAAGFLVKFFGKTIYFAGDTALFGDMALIGREGIDVAILPIGDNYTMGPADAAEAVGLLKPKAVIPMHYNTHELIRQDPMKFKKLVEDRFGIPVHVVDPGQSIVL